MKASRLIEMLSELMVDNPDIEVVVQEESYDGSDRKVTEPILTLVKQCWDDLYTKEQIESMMAQIEQYDPSHQHLRTIWGTLSNDLKKSWGSLDSMIDSIQRRPQLRRLEQAEIFAKAPWKILVK